MNTFGTIAVFWTVLYICYGAYFSLSDWLNKKNGGSKSLGGYAVMILAAILLTIAVIVVCEWRYVKPTEEKTKKAYMGIPITIDTQTLEGKIFKPHAFFVTQKRILIYNDDGKVYALDNIKLDNLKPEQLTTNDNASYVVYRKADQLFFGKY